MYALKVLTVKVPERYIRELDRLVKEGLFVSRGEAVRHAIREYLRTLKLRSEDKLIIG